MLTHILLHINTVTVVNRVSNLAKTKDIPQLYDQSYQHLSIISSYELGLFDEIFQFLYLCSRHTDKEKTSKREKTSCSST